MAQEYLPRRIGMASGLSIGLSIGLGGIAAVGLGALADSVDLQAAMYAAAAAPLVALALAALLPGPARRDGWPPSRSLGSPPMEPREFFESLERASTPPRRRG